MLNNALINTILKYVIRLENFYKSNNNIEEFKNFIEKEKNELEQIKRIAKLDNYNNRFLNIYVNNYNTLQFNNIPTFVNSVKSNFLGGTL